MNKTLHAPFVYSWLSTHCVRCEKQRITGHKTLLCYAQICLLMCQFNKKITGCLSIQTTSDEYIGIIKLITTLANYNSVTNYNKG